MISLISWQNFGWSAIAQKTWIFNELAERNIHEENGEISPRALYVKRKDLTSLFGRKDTMDEIISEGNRRNHRLCVAIPDEGTGEAPGGMSRNSIETGRCRGKDIVRSEITVSFRGWV